jgi:type II secretory pathway component PulF
MTTFRYRAVHSNGTPVEGVLDADDRRTALRTLGQRGLHPSRLDPVLPTRSPAPASASSPAATPDPRPHSQTLPPHPDFPARHRPPAPRPPPVAGSAAGKSPLSPANSAPSSAPPSPSPRPLDGLGEEEENPALRTVVLGLAESVRKGVSLSSALEEHPRQFPRLYVSMVKVGEEAGALPSVMNDLADLMEHEDEVRGEVRAAVAYPAFVLGFGVFTVLVLLTVVLPRLFGMLQDMLPSLPLPTLILLRISKILHGDWPWILAAGAGAFFGLRHFFSSPRGREAWDGLRLRLPVLGPLFRAAALGRFARTLGTLAKSGVSLLPALRIVEETIGNVVLARQVARVAEETRGGDSLAAPLRKMGIFPKAVIQMIEVGEETGRLDAMLLKIAEIEERHMRARTKTLISLLAPALILVVGALVGFMVIALLLPIFKMSRAIH